jgi:NAD(P)-dependent dehydrogenase (short-subunit alcohol dehydrogenase family)
MTTAIAPTPGFSIVSVPTGCTASREQVIRPIGETTIVNRAAQREEIAETIAFVATDRADYITGATIAVDGSRTAI